MWTIIEDKEKPATPLPEIDQAIELQEEQRPRPGLRKKLVYFIAVIALGLILFLQCLIHFTQTVIAVPLLRQPVVWTCQVFECQVPIRQRPDDWLITTSSMAHHPDFQKAWRLKAELQHQGNQAISLPAVLVTFYDRQGDAAGARRFTPAEYQDKIASNTTSGGHAQEWQPGSMVSLVLDIVDPGTGLPNFDITLAPLPEEVLP